jgi:hypothetical protein
MKACHESARRPDERYGPRRHKGFMHLEFVDLSDPLDRLQRVVQTPVHLQNEATEATVAAPTDSAAVAAFCRCPSPLLIPGRAASQPLPPLDPPAPLFPSSRACSSSTQAAANRGIQAGGSTCSSSELHPAARGIQAGGSRPW